MSSKNLIDVTIPFQRDQVVMYVYFSERKSKLISNNPNVCDDLTASLKDYEYDANYILLRLVI